MIKHVEKIDQKMVACILAALILFGCGSLKKLNLAKKNKIGKGILAYYWDKKWTKIGTLRWHKHGNSLYINEEKGWAKGTFGRVENHDNYYQLKPVYKFTVVEPNMREKKMVVRMGYIEDENVWSFSKCLEGCWSGKITFEPGSKVLDETVVRDYEMKYMKMDTMCVRKSPPY